MKDFREKIEKQFEFNHRKNLLGSGMAHSLKFSPETLRAIEIFRISEPGNHNLMVEYLTRRALEEFCRVNQYYSFNESDRKALKTIYTELLYDLSMPGSDTDNIASQHYTNLKNWLIQANPFSESLYQDKGDLIEAVVCSEYPPDLQVKVLNINVGCLAEPVLDIGCGKNGYLVEYLRKIGIKAYGIDRFQKNQNFFINSDWLEFEFIKKKWGTIISNLGFSNHFAHHHLRSDGNYLIYAGKYVEILNSLRVGGCFFYAPALPFIEEFLDKQQYQIQNRQIDDFKYKSSCITRMR